MISPPSMYHFDSFVIRPLQQEDAQVYFRLFQDNRARFAPWFPKTSAAMQDVESAVSHVLQCLLKVKTKECFIFVILDTRSLDIIGALYIKDIDWNVLKCDLGYLVDRHYEGKGIVSKSLTWLLPYVFEITPINKIVARVAEHNLESRRVVERLAFTLEGILKDDFMTGDGKLVSLAHYGLLRSEAR